MDRIAGTAQELGGIVEETAGRITGDRAQEARGVLHQAAGVARSAQGQVRERIGEAVDAVVETADHAREEVRRGVTQASEQARHVYDSGRRHLLNGTGRVTAAVDDRPLAAVVLAGAVGYLAALLIHGRR